MLHKLFSWLNCVILPAMFQKTVGISKVMILRNRALWFPEKKKGEVYQGDYNHCIAFNHSSTFYCCFHNNIIILPDHLNFFSKIRTIQAVSVMETKV